MKEVTQDYISNEEAEVRKPVELYHLWQDGIEDWYYTSSDTVVDYDGNQYAPATISRGEIRYESNLDANTLTLKFGYLEDPINDYIDQVMVDELWIEVLKIHRGQSPYEPLCIFIGKIISVSFQGVIAEAKCVGLQEHFKKVIPYYRYQPACNHTLYDPDTCKVDKNSYKHTILLTGLSEDGLTLTSSDFDDPGLGTDYLTFGWIEFGNYKRMVTSHTDDVITIRYGLPGLQNGNTVTAYAGCDRLLLTCRDKFDNVDKFLGFPFIPWTNPVTKQ